ncbi:phosphotransferase [candidate division WOR-3 bacterium]|nr:phosphotransferase [candidate division WOR-3 bacterium]
MKFSLEENLKFLIIEVKKQIVATKECLSSPHENDASRILSPGNYVDNLKNIILKKAYSSLSKSTKETDLMTIMSLNTIASNLERIGDLCESISKQTSHIFEKSILQNVDFDRYFNEIFNSIDLIEKSFFTKNTQNAIKICRTELILDGLYKEDFTVLVEKIKKAGDRTREYLALYTIIRYLERIGDAFQNIGEAIISSVAGTRLKIYDFTMLKEKTKCDIVFLEDIGVETKSGCRIERIKTNKKENSNDNIIYKEGNRDKLQKEDYNLKIWSEKFPDLVPKTFGFMEKDNNAVLLIQYLDAMNFQQLVFTENDKTVEKAVKRLCDKIKTVWIETKKDTPAKSDFINQVLTRIDDVIGAHPEFDELELSVLDIRQIPIKNLLLQLKSLEEKKFTCSFSVLLHGDFNSDNILYGQAEDRIFFVDLFRSKYGDYVQDLSVFLVSNFRIPIFDNSMRSRIDEINNFVLSQVRIFACSANDPTFEQRLSIGVARSLITSTRFALEKDFAKEMLLRSRYLLEKLKLSDSQKNGDFIFPVEILSL